MVENCFVTLRINKIRIIEHLYDAWASERRAEWSIWMVHSKIEIPHRYLRSGVDDFSYRNGLEKAGTSWKSSEDVIMSLSPKLSYQLTDIKY